MTTYNFFLLIHIAGACITGLAGIYTAFILGSFRRSAYHHSAVTLGFLGGFQVLSGIILAFVSPQITTLSLCNNIALYLSAWFLLEILLILRMKKISTSFPYVPAFSPVIASLLLMIAAISYGF